MWSVNSDTWKPVFDRGRAHRWENRVEHHAGMSAANQRGRRSVLRRRCIDKSKALTAMLACATRNLELRLEGGTRGPSN